MPLVGVHGLHGDVPAIADGLLGHLPGETAEALLPALPVVLRVQLDAAAALAAPVHGVARELLDGVQGLAPAADEGAQVLPLQEDLVAALLRLIDPDLGLGLHLPEKAGEELLDGLGLGVVHLLAQGGGGQGRGSLALRQVLPGLGLGLRPGLLSLGGTGLVLLCGTLASLGPLRLGGGGLGLRDGLGTDGLRGGLLHLLAVGNADDSRGSAQSQKAALCPLQHPDGDIVPVHVQLGQGLGQGLLHGLSADINITHGSIAPYSSSCSRKARPRA